MNEKVLFEKSFFKIRLIKPFGVIGIAMILIGELFYNAFNELYYNSEVYVESDSYWSSGYYEYNNFYRILSDLFSGIALLGIVCVVIVIVMLIIYLFLNCKLMITDKRVYAEIKYGKKIELPLDSITAIGSSILNSIAVTTASGTIRVIFMPSRNEAYDVISKLLLARQKNITQMSFGDMSKENNEHFVDSTPIKEKENFQDISNKNVQQAPKQVPINPTLTKPDEKEIVTQREESEKEFCEICGAMLEKEELVCHVCGARIK